MFSGFVKGVDPMGTQYKIADYFIAYHMNWAVPASLYLSVFMCMFEFLMGVLVLLNVRMRLVAWLVLLMMLFFTVTTFYDALYSPVSDCGCFGDAIKLTNWQTFYKNIFIMIFVLIFFFSRKIIRPTFTVKGELVVTFGTIILFLGFEAFNLYHLPVIDFGAWKPGTRLAPENPKPLQFFLTYKNKQTGEEKEYLSPNYPYSDSVWMSKWEFKSQRIVDPNPKGPAIVIEDSKRNNLTDNIIKNPDYQFLLISDNLNTANRKIFAKVIDFYKSCLADNHSFVFLTSSLPEDILKFKKDLNLDDTIQFLYSDDTTLQAMIRSNPGLMLIHNSKILAKWHFHDFPEYSKVKDKYIK